MSWKLTLSRCLGSVSKLGTGDSKDLASPRIQAVFEGKHHSEE